MLAMSSLATWPGRRPSASSRAGHSGESKAVAGAAEDLLVVGVPVLVPEEERLHARALQSELQLVGAVGGVDVDQCGSGAGAAHVHHDPFDAVGGPDADAVAAAY